MMQAESQVQNGGKIGLSDSIEGHLLTYFAALEGELPAPGLYARVLKQFEEPLFRLVMGLCEGNQLRAAHVLGLNRNTLRKKIREYGLLASQSVSKRKRAS